MANKETLREWFAKAMREGNGYGNTREQIITWALRCLALEGPKGKLPQGKQVREAIMARCADRAQYIETMQDGTLIVPSVAACPNRTVGAWMQYLGLSAECTMMILSSERGRCWIKHPGKTSVTAYG